MDAKDALIISHHVGHKLNIFMGGKEMQADLDLHSDFEEFMGKLPKEKCYSFVLNYVMEYTGCAFGGIRILDENGFIPYEFFVGFTEEFCQGENWLSLHRDNCVCIRAVQGAFEPQDLSCVTPYGSFYTNNSQKFIAGLSENEQKRFRGRCVESGFISIAVIPLFDRGKIIGAIHLADCSENKVGREKIEGLERITPLIVEAIKIASSKVFQTLIVQQIKQSVIVLGLDLQILFWNDQAQELFGWTGGEAIGKIINQIGWESDGEEAFTGRKDEDFLTSEYQWTKKDGTKIWVQASVSRIKNIHGVPIGYILVCHDISSQKAIEKEIRRFEQLHLVGQIAAGMAHEIRNSMTTVRGFLQLYSGEKMKSSEKEYYELMIEELDRANGIITDFLSLAKDRVINLKRENLNNIIKHVSRLIQASAIKEDKEIIFELEDIPDLSLDDNEIKKLILNLIQNGLESMEKGSILFVKTYVSDQEIVLEVKDSGCGIPQEVVDKIGQPFVTTKENGLGLGLSECYSVCARHHAQLDFSTGPKGTTFYVKFTPDRK